VGDGTSRAASAQRRITLRVDEIVSTVVDGQVVLLDLRQPGYLRINRSGRLLWERLEAGASPRDLEVALVERYGIDQERAGEDVAQFLAILAARDLLV
jgi:hypothetical protein